MGQCKCAYRKGCDYIWGDYRGGRLYLPGHMPSSEHLEVDEHQIKIYRYNFELWLTGPIVMRMRGYLEFEVDSLAMK